MKENEILEKCPIEVGLSFICKKWRIQIIRDIFYGKHRFNEFKENNPGISNKVLSNCLKELEDINLIKKEVKDKTVEYNLTSFGKSLNKVLYELAIFALDGELSGGYFEDKRKEELKEIVKENLL